MHKKAEDKPSGLSEGFNGTADAVAPMMLTAATGQPSFQYIYTLGGDQFLFAVLPQFSQHRCQSHS